MKKLFTLLLAHLIVLSMALAQSGWEQQVSGTTQTLKACQFLNNNDGFAAGGNSFLTTLNGGETWISRSTDTLVSGINGMSFINANTGWITGTPGIAKTTDRGNTWTLQEPATSGATNDVFFFDVNNGWAVGPGAVILWTTNSGMDWNMGSLGGREDINAVFFVSASQGWAVGSNAEILVSTDGGANWNTQSSGTFTGDLFDVHMLNSTSGFVTGDGGTVLKTTDGGANWFQLDTKTTDDFFFVYFLDSNYGWAGGYFGTIVHTKDGGATWKMQASTISSPLYDIYFTSMTTGWAAGTQGKIIHSITGGDEIKANFVADTTIGIRPLTVHFTNQSTGYPSSYSWIFGDGGTSTEENPTHTYTAAGAFTVSLSITSGTYTGTRTKSDYIIVDDVLTADFTATPTAGSSTLTVSFQDASLSTPATWLWDFGDETSSTFENPTHSYEVPGQYTVSLTVTNYQGSSTETKEDFITVYEPIQAAFQGAPITGPAPLTVNFVDYSPGHPNSWNWSFGDGGTSTEQNPTHTYQNSGTYTVTLSVSDGIHSDTKSYHSYIRVTDALNPEFTASPRSGDLPLTVSFTDMSYGGPNAWVWSFGDGEHSSEQNPQHTYILPGTYDVELTISDGTFQATEMKPDYIVVTGTPVLDADFSASPLSGIEPLNVQFTDLTQGGVLRRTWIFGDGSTSTERNPSHRYSNDGVYSVSLIVTNGLNYDTAYKSEYITVYPQQQYELNADFTADITEGDRPLLVSFTDLTTGSPNSYNWNFGDGNTSTVKDPTNYYSISGTFTVSLTVRDSLGNEDTESKMNYIVINEPIGVEETENNNLLFIESYPNPFKEFTSIIYGLNTDAFVTVKIHDILGNEIITLIEINQNKGNYNLIWNPSNTNGLKSTGVYIFSITSSSEKGTESKTGKLIFIE